MIEVKSMVRRFGPKTVLKEIDFHVPAGKICGFVGPNGAGKTTTMRILASLDLPDHGVAKIGDADVRKNTKEVRKLVGFMPDYYGTYSDLVVSEYLDFFARAFHLKSEIRKKRLDDLIAFTELTPILGTPVEGLSKGQKQRLSLARTLLSDPQLLILDEPAAGLDPRARVELRELLKVLASQGKTIFISSHILSELSDLIDWLVIIDDGQIKHSGPPDMGQESHAEGVIYLLQFRSPEQQVRRALLEVEGVSGVDGEGDTLALRVDPERVQAHLLLKRLVESGVEVEQFYRREMNLEDVFMKVTEG